MKVSRLSQKIQSSDPFLLAPALASRYDQYVDCRYLINTSVCV
jgi:hypothetical protein